MPVSELSKIKKELQSLSSQKQAKIAAWFFKTGPGDYGEGDQFIGIKVPVQRQAARRFKALPLKDVEKLLQSKIHEHRLTALFILDIQFREGALAEKKDTVNLYLRNLKHVNNWDLVDSSAPYLLGEYLQDKPREILYILATSKDLWQKRVAMLSTYAFIKKGDFTDALKIAEVLLKDSHDLIHKAVGWMLREVGNRDRKTEERFLRKHSKDMPRTMLRYAIEKFPKSLRESYMKK
ncbi:MAG: DNA alkylation repair protein [bacterium]|nr:DNA alkylation repair protein [bacterium]